MQIKHVAVIGVFAGLYVCGCDEKSTNDGITYPTSTFPLIEGARWNYDIFYESPIDTTTADSLAGELHRAVVGIDTSNGYMVMDDTTIWYSDGIHDTTVSRFWCAVDENSFRVHAFDRDGEGIMWPLEEYDEPRILLDFPLIDGKTWDTPTGGFRYSKEVLKLDIVYFHSVEIECVLILSVWMGPFDGYPEDIYEWYSNDGLMAKETIRGNSRITLKLLDYSISSKGN